MKYLNGVYYSLWMVIVLNFFIPLGVLFEIVLPVMTIFYTILTTILIMVAIAVKYFPENVGKLSEDDIENMFAIIDFEFNIEMVCRLLIVVVLLLSGLYFLASLVVISKVLLMATATSLLNSQNIERV